MKEFDMDSVFVMEVIICSKARRGDGKKEPIRVITEVFTKDGELIAEFDPWEMEKPFIGIQPGGLDRPIKFSDSVKDVIKEVMDKQEFPQ